MLSTHFALLALSAFSAVFASPVARQDSEEKIVCHSTVYGGYLRVNSPQSGHGAIPYNYPLEANATGTIVTSHQGERVTFMDCQILLTQAPRYDTTYNAPPAYGLVKVLEGDHAGKCLGISKLPNETNQEAGHQEFVNFQVFDCPTNTDGDLLHHTWFRVDAQHEDGTYDLSYVGNNTDNHPSLLGNSKQGEPVQGYYGSIGPAAGQFQLNPNATAS